MGIFKKSDEELAELREKQAQKTSEALDKEEVKARQKAEKAGFDTSNALYVFTALNDDNDSIRTIFGLIYPDRIVKCQKQFLGSATEEILVKNISSIEKSTGLLPTVHVYASPNSISFKVGLEGQKIVDTVRSLMLNNQNSTTSQISNVEQLEKLASLLEKGLLTPEEFQEQKARLLS